MTLIDIRPADLETVRRILREHVPAVEVRAFGSRVSWNARGTSDLDLAVMADEPLGINRTAKLRAAFTDSDLPFRVDIVDWATVSESFRQRILKNHVVLTRQAVEVHSSTKTSRAGADDGTSRKDWRNTHWGDLVTLEYGRALRTYGTGEGEFRVFGTNGPIGWHDEALSKSASVIVGRKGAYRGIHYSHGPCFVIDTAFYLRPKAELDVRWAYYTLLTQDINGLDSGSAIPSTSREDFYGLPVYVPPLAEQHAIAHILGTLDDKIELNRRMNATLEAMVRALFRSWFVDFDPVRAKMAGRDTGLPKEVADLFSDRLVDSELGEMPEGWTIGTLGDIAAAPRSGIDPGKVADDMPYIGLEHMPRRSVALTDWGQAGSVSSTKTAFENRDMLFGKLRPYFHKVGIAPVNGVCSTDIVVLRARTPEWSAFVLACVSSAGFVGYVSQTSTGTKMPPTSWRTMSRYEIRRPAVTVAAAFQHVVSPMFERIVANVHESRTLGRLRDALLPKLVSGELRVDGVEPASGRDDHRVPVGTQGA